VKVKVKETSRFVSEKKIVIREPHAAATYLIEALRHTDASDSTQLTRRRPPCALLQRMLRCATAAVPGQLCGRSCSVSSGPPPQ
jgi:hypothetical protein